MSTNESDSLCCGMTVVEESGEGRVSAPDSDTPHATHDARTGITEANPVVKFVVKMASRADNVLSLQ